MEEEVKGEVVGGVGKADKASDMSLPSPSSPTSSFSGLFPQTTIDSPLRAPSLPTPTINAKGDKGDKGGSEVLKGINGKVEGGVYGKGGVVLGRDAWRERLSSPSPFSSTSSPSTPSTFTSPPTPPTPPTLPTPPTPTPSSLSPKLTQMKSDILLGMGIEDIGGDRNGIGGIGVRPYETINSGSREQVGVQGVQGVQGRYSGERFVGSDSRTNRNIEGRNVEGRNKRQITAQTGGGSHKINKINKMRENDSSYNSKYKKVIGSTSSSYLEDIVDFS